MSKTVTITMRIEPELKAGAEKVLKELGMTTTQAITTFLTQVKLQRGLPFKVELPTSNHVPNAQTQASFDETESEVVTDFKVWMNENT
jgi:DNA-damage-inducible protein J